MAEFLTAYKVTAEFEGGYSNDKTDRGLETYAGISRKFHPTWAGWAIVDRNKPLRHNQKIRNDELASLVKQFYYREFWQPIQGDLIEHQRIANFVYDYHVNSGEWGLKRIQRALNLKSDGKIGAISLKALQTADIEVLKAARLQHIKEIVKKYPGQKRFERGWVSRLSKL